MNRKHRLGYLLVLLLFALQSGCSGLLTKLGSYEFKIYYNQQQLEDSHSDDHIEITYLGTSGFLFRRGDYAILTDPFFSNPGILKVALGSIEPNHDRIDAFLEKYGVDFAGVHAIFVGHAHYDHLMDVPYVALDKAKDATIYTSQTGKNIIHSKFKTETDRLRSFAEVACPTPSGSDSCWQCKNPCPAPSAEHWISVADGRIRVLPVPSQHAPHLNHISLYEGFETQPLDSVPTKAAGYRKGRVYSFVIDFMSDDSSEVDFRIYLQDSAAGGTFGFPPQGIDGFDLAILVAAGHQNVTDHPNAIMKRLAPKRVIVSHWESFFRSPLKNKPRTVPGTDVRAFLEKLDAIPPREFTLVEPMLLPAPGSRVVYPIRD